jgi:hypothetical protein
MKKHKKHIWLPLAILIYAIVMGFVMIERSGVTREFWIMTCVEVVFIVVLYFILRGQDRRRDRDEIR